MEVVKQSFDVGINGVNNTAFDNDCGPREYVLTENLPTMDDDDDDALLVSSCDSNDEMYCEIDCCVVVVGVISND